MDSGSGLEDITLAELIHMAIDSRLIDLHVSLPAKVESYDASTQTVSVTPMINRMVPDGDTPPNYVSEKLPKLADVPVKFQRCKQFTMTFPLVAGDYGLLVFCERNPGTFRSTGNQSDPGDLSMHGLGGAVFIPGMYPDANAAQTADATNMIIGSDTDGNSRIEVKPTGGINLGAGATRGVARSNDSVNCGTLAVVMGTGPLAASVASVVYVDANGATNTLTTGNLGPANMTGKISSSSSHIKAVD